MSNVITFTPNNRVNPDAQELLDDLKATVYKYAGKVSLAEAFGCIEIAKSDLAAQLLQKD
jgi:hypothetical protein